MRSRSSSFSLSRALAVSTGEIEGGCGAAAVTEARPARSWRFSSSSSATRRSRYENWALRLSREFWAAMRLRCARASLRSSGDASARGRLRDEPAFETMVVDGGEDGAGEALGDGRERVEGSMLMVGRKEGRTVSCLV